MVLNPDLGTGGGVSAVLGTRVGFNAVMVVGTAVGTGMGPPFSSPEPLGCHSWKVPGLEWPTLVHRTTDYAQQVRRSVAFSTEHHQDREDLQRLTRRQEYRTMGQEVKRESAGLEPLMVGRLWLSV